MTTYIPLPLDYEYVLLDFTSWSIYNDNCNSQQGLHTQITYIFYNEITPIQDGSYA